MCLGVGERPAKERVAVAVDATSAPGRKLDLGRELVGLGVVVAILLGVDRARTTVVVECEDIGVGLPLQEELGGGTACGLVGGRKRLAELIGRTRAVLACVPRQGLEAGVVPQRRRDLGKGSRHGLDGRAHDRRGVAVLRVEVVDDVKGVVASQRTQVPLAREGARPCVGTVDLCVARLARMRGKRGCDLGGRAVVGAGEVGAAREGVIVDRAVGGVVRACRCGNLRRGVGAQNGPELRAAAEHALGQGDRRQVKARKVNQLELGRGHEHEVAVLDRVGHDAREVERGELGVSLEHTTHVAYGTHVDAREVDGGERWVVTEHALGRGGRAHVKRSEVERGH